MAPHPPDLGRSEAQTDSISSVKARPWRAGVGRSGSIPLPATSVSGRVHWAPVGGDREDHLAQHLAVQVLDGEAAVADPLVVLPHREGCPTPGTGLFHLQLAALELLREIGRQHLEDPHAREAATAWRRGRRPARQGAAPPRGAGLVDGELAAGRQPVQRCGDRLGLREVDRAGVHRGSTGRRTARDACQLEVRARLATFLPGLPRQPVRRGAVSFLVGRTRTIGLHQHPQLERRQLRLVPRDDTQGLAMFLGAHRPHGYVDDLVEASGEPVGEVDHRVDWSTGWLLMTRSKHDHRQSCWSKPGLCSTRGRESQLDVSPRIDGGPPRGSRAGTCQNAHVSASTADSGRLAGWCRKHLGSPPAEELFRSAHLSTVVGVRLGDGREVVVKVRPDSPRAAGCVAVQRRMFDAGFPCPQPLTGVVRFGDDVASAESYVPGGALLPRAEHSARLFAEAFARLIQLVPRPCRCPRARPPTVLGSLEPRPHAGCGRARRAVTSTSTRLPVLRG